MIRWILFPLLALMLGAGLAVYLRDDAGYVLIQLAGYTIESTVAGLVVLSVVAGTVLTVVLRLVRGSLRLPGQVGRLLQERRERIARRQLRLGLQHLATEDWQRAEAELLRRTGEQDTAAISYLYAAQAAHALGAADRRDHYLTQAAEQPDHIDEAVRLEQARMWAEDGRIDDALLTLEKLCAQAPRMSGAWRLRLQILAELKRWDSLAELLPKVRDLLPGDTLHEYARQAWIARLQAAGADLATLQQHWRDMPRPIRQDIAVLTTYVRQLHLAHADTDAQRLITTRLKHEWHPTLARAFGELSSENTVDQLACVEEWIKRHGEQPELLFIAGKLCLRHELWGRARSYLDAYREKRPDDLGALLELGRLAARMSKPDEALAMFRSGLEQAVEGPPATAALPPPSA